MAGRDRRQGEDEQEGEGFLGRWSRRKAEARQTEAEEARDHEQTRESPSSTASPQTGPDVIDPRDLPDIDSLTAESDFTVFMRKGVPPELRQQALRKLWRSSPVLANLDGLLEYGGDYTHIGRGGTSVQTAYQVGRGFVRKIEEIAGDAQAEPADASAEGPEPVPAATDDAAATEPPAAGELERDRAVAAAGADRPAGDHTSVSSRPRRRLPKRRS